MPRYLFPASQGWGTPSVRPFGYEKPSRPETQHRHPPQAIAIPYRTRLANGLDLITGMNRRQHSTTPPPLSPRQSKTKKQAHSPSINQLHRTIILIIPLTLPTLPTTITLRTDTYTVPHLNILHLRSHLDDLPNHLVPHGKRVRHLAPPARDGVQVRGAHATGIDLDVDVVVGEVLELEGPFVEVRVGGGAVDLEADRFFGVGHFCGWRGGGWGLWCCWYEDRIETKRFVGTVSVGFISVLEEVFSVEFSKLKSAGRTKDLFEKRYDTSGSNQ